MKDKDLKSNIQDWAQQIGPGEAWKKLTEKGISLSLAQKLTAGSYEGEINKIYAGIILKAMKKSA